MAPEGVLVLLVVGTKIHAEVFIKSQGSGDIAAQGIAIGLKPFFFA